MSAAASASQALLQVEEVHKRLADHHVLCGASLTVCAGESAVVRGPNGSGKSTLLRLIVGILEPDRGAVRIAGQLPPLGLRQLGYVPDASDALPDLLAGEFVTLCASLKGAPLPALVLRERLGVAPLWRQPLGSLSFGQRKRTCLLAALVGDPALLVLDEPSNGLDPDGVALLLEVLGEQRRTGAVLLSTNDDSFAEAFGGPSYRLVQGRLQPAVS